MTFTSFNRWWELSRPALSITNWGERGCTNCFSAEAVTPTRESQTARPETLTPRPRDRKQTTFPGIHFDLLDKQESTEVPSDEDPLFLGLYKQQCYSPSLTMLLCKQKGTVEIARATLAGSYQQKDFLQPA